MRVDRQSFQSALDALSKYSDLIRAFEEDMTKRRCILDASTAKLMWKRSGGAGGRIALPDGTSLSDQPAKIRAQFTEADLEALADAADAVMATFIADGPKTPPIVPISSAQEVTP